MRDETGARNAFLALWSIVLVVKVVLAMQLPLFVDEAFYWQEGQHLAWAYSDLPGLTAWLARIGVSIGGDHQLALRAPFLLIAALLPWLVRRITAREFDAACAWQAASLSLLLPLAGSLGLLALPDAAMAFATLVCIDAAARLLRETTAGAAAQLAAGLAIGALSHYRFIAVIGVGMVVLLALPQGRRALRDPRVWIAIAFGAAAWTPLIAWNMDNADAGLRFQLVDRHPWAFHSDGLLFVLVQGLLVTPLLFVAMARAAGDARRAAEPVRLLAWLGALVVLGFFVLGFFADTERVSFHWPLPGYLALLPLLPAALRRWSRPWRVATWGMAGLGLALMFAYYAAVSVPSLRAHAAAWKWYPSNFAGWSRLGEAVRRMQRELPAGTRVVADNFKIGAELGFELGDPRIAVLDHPLNRRHGRAPQLQLWGLQHGDSRAQWGSAPVLLVVGATDVQYRGLLQRYHALCRMVGPLPPPRVLNIDHGSQRFLLFALPAGAPATDAACTTPALAWIDAPVSGARVGRRFAIEGWAFKDGVGLRRVEVLLDGHVVGEVPYGLPSPGTAAFWRISNDPNHPDVGFRGSVTLPEGITGRHWLGLRLHGEDGSVEDWAEQPITIAAE